MVVSPSARERARVGPLERAEIGLERRERASCVGAEAGRARRDGERGGASRCRYIARSLKRKGQRDGWP